MPPLKRGVKAQAKPKAPSRVNTKNEKQAPNTEDDGITEEIPSKKRKTDLEPKEAQKAPRRSVRGASNSQPPEEQLIRYMLSKDAEELCRPDEESQFIKTHSKARTYSSVLNPFEELLCVVILSRPISHRLGLRSIRTVLNDPYNFTSAKATKAAGTEKHHQALWDAKTQHKQKTAEQIGQVADIVLDKFTASGDKEGTQLQQVLEASDGDVDKALNMLKENIKGLGATGLNIFLRRVQWLWSNAFPFIDDKTGLALKKIGLPDDPEELREVVEKHWNKVDKKLLAGEDEAAKKRRAFVIILDRAIGVDLDNKSDALLEAVAAIG